jgi:hypothetical protein
VVLKRARGCYAKLDDERKKERKKEDEVEGERL